MTHLPEKLLLMLKDGKIDRKIIIPLFLSRFRLKSLKPRYYIMKFASIYCRQRKKFAWSSLNLGIPSLNFSGFEI